MSLNAGKTRRMKRLFDETGRTVILPLDIVVPVGRFEGAQDAGALLDMASAMGVKAVLLRWGEAKRYADRIDPGVGLVVRISGSTGVNNDDRWPVQLNSVQASAAIGGDAVLHRRPDRRRPRGGVAAEPGGGVRGGGAARRRGAGRGLRRRGRRRGYPSGEGPGARLGSPHRAGARCRPREGSPPGFGRGRRGDL